MPVINNPRASSYRKAFGNQTAYSTAGGQRAHGMRIRNRPKKISTQKIIEISTQNNYLFRPKMFDTK